MDGLVQSPTLWGMETGSQPRSISEAIERAAGFPRLRYSLALSALVLSAARKQPRGVFTFTEMRYDDGRRDLRLPLREHFVEAVAAYNSVVYDSQQTCRAIQSDVFDVNPEFDLVYLDPPYAPPRDDNCYIKRYHFLEGLSVYWRGQEIMQNTKTKKFAKRYTPGGCRVCIHRKMTHELWETKQIDGLYTLTSLGDFRADLLAAAMRLGLLSS